MVFSSFLICPIYSILFLLSSLPTNFAKQDIYGDLIKYLKMYNDIDVGSLVALDGNIDNLGAPAWFKYATLDEEDLLIDSFFPLIYLKMDDLTFIPSLLEAMSRSKDSSLVVVDGYFQHPFTSKELFSYLSEDLLHQHIWLFLYPYSNITEKNIETLPIYEELQKQKYLTLISQVYLLSGNHSYSHLFEIYQICPEVSLTVNHVKTFHANQNLSKETDFIWDRRKDLSGCSIRVSYFEDYPHVMIANDDKDVEEDQYLRAGNMAIYGTQAELFGYFMKELNFTVKWVYEKSKLYGAFDHKTQKWNGIIGQLHVGEADMSIFHLSVVLSRSLVISFSNPIETNDFGLYMQNPEQSLTWSTYSQVFPFLYWLTVAILAATSCVCLFAAFEIHSQKMNGEKSIIKFRAQRIANNIGSGVTVVGLSLGEQDVNQVREVKYSSPFSLKILYLTIVLFGSLNFKIWESGLTSNLAVQSFEHPIKHLGDLLQHLEYHLFFLKGSAAELYFLDAAELEEYSEAKTLWSKRLDKNKNRFIESNDEHEVKILKDKTNVLFADSFTARLWANYPCKITTAVTRYNKHSLAFPFKKNSPFIKVFDNVLDFMRETGSLSNTHRHIAAYKPLSVCDQKREWSIGYQNIFSSFVIIGIGCFVAILIWILECFCINI